MSERAVEYDVRRGGIQRVHDHTPSRCWMWARSTAKRTAVVHVSLGGPCWWLPNVRRRRYAGIAEYGVGWLLLAVQVAHRSSPTSQEGTR